MQWSDAVKPPSTKVLRQFAGLLVIVFSGLAAWRWWHDSAGVGTVAVAAAAVLAGLVGLVFPAAVRPIYTGWMIVAFPIGWTVSRLVLAAIFFVVITPVAILFKILRRDALHLRDRNAVSNWLPKAQPGAARDYFRQF